MEQKKKRKFYLVYMFSISAFFNIFGYLYLSQYTFNTDYSKIDAHIENVRNGNVEITPEKYILALEHRRTAFESTEDMLDGYQDIFKIYIGVNLFIVGLLCSTLWRELKRANH